MYFSELLLPESMERGLARLMTAATTAAVGRVFGGLLIFQLVLEQGGAPEIPKICRAFKLCMNAIKGVH